MKERNIQREKEKHEDSFYSKKRKMERKALHVSYIHQTFMDTYYIVKQKRMKQKQVRHYSFQSSSSSVPQRLSAPAALG